MGVATLVARRLVLIVLFSARPGTGGGEVKCADPAGGVDVCLARVMSPAAAVIGAHSSTAIVPALVADRTGAQLVGSQRYVGARIRVA